MTALSWDLCPVYPCGLYAALHRSAECAGLRMSHSDIFCAREKCGGPKILFPTLLLKCVLVDSFFRHAFAFRRCCCPASSVLCCWRRLFFAQHSFARSFLRLLLLVVHLRWLSFAAAAAQFYYGVISSIHEKVIVIMPSFFKNSFFGCYSMLKLTFQPDISKTHPPSCYTRVECYDESCTY